MLPWLHAWLINSFGFSSGTIVGLILAFVLYLIAAWYFISGLAPPNLRFYCVLSVILGWTLYGGLRVFAYSEAFLTARSFAEPAALLGLGLLYRKRFGLALIAFGVALGCHPLVGASGALIAWIILINDDKRWIFASIAVLVVTVAAGIVHFGPFADLFVRYDTEWLALVQEANPHAFVFHWSPQDFGLVIFDTAVLLLVIRNIENSRLAQFARAAYIAGWGSVLTSVLFVDLANSAFIGKLQIWRVLWIMHWIATAILPVLLVDLWNRKSHGRLAALFLAVGWMAPFSIAPAPLGILAAIVDRLRKRITVTPLTVRMVGAIAMLSVLVILVQYEARVFKFASLLDEPARNVIGQAIAENLLVLGAVIGIWTYATTVKWVAPIATALLLITAISLWDQRAPWTRRLESYPVGTHIWPGLIEPGAKVYWYRDLIAPWVLLGHGNYYTQQQGSGAVFSRDLVVELDKRRKVTAILDFQEQICHMMNNLNEKATSCEPDSAAVRTVCTEGGIDYVVLQSTLEGATPLANYSTGVVENGYEKKLYLYRCSVLQHG